MAQLPEQSSAHRISEDDNKRYLYVMLSSSGLAKVGISKDVEQRRKQVEFSGGHSVSIHKVYGPFNEARKLEAAIHRRLEKSRSSGEWFSGDLIGITAEVEDEILSFVDKEKPLEPDNSAAASQMMKWIEEGVQKPFKDSNELFEEMYGKWEALATKYTELVDELGDARELVDEYYKMLTSALAIGNKLAIRNKDLDAELNALQSLAQPSLLN